MSQPIRVTLKRKASEEPPQILYLETREAPQQQQQQIHYVRQEPARSSASATETRRKRVKAAGSDFVRRVFRLDRQRTWERYTHDDVGAVATITEKISQSLERSGAEAKDDGDQELKLEVVPEEPLKRSSGRVYTPRKGMGEGLSDAQTVGLTEEELEEWTQQALVEEGSRGDKTPQGPARPQQQRTLLSPNSQRQRVTPPRLSGKRSSEIHKQRIASYNHSSNILPEAVRSNPSKKAEDEDGEYVYDTYILAPTNALANPTETMDIDNVGYLIITAEDEELWETYIDEETARRDRENENPDEDEDDENAEDFYGADYPEHEIDSEDEFDRGAYGYRSRRGGGMSDDEEWDGDPAAFSGDEDEDGELDNVFSSAGYQRMAAQYLKT